MAKFFPTSTPHPASIPGAGPSSQSVTFVPIGGGKTPAQAHFAATQNAAQKTSPGGILAHAARDIRGLPSGLLHLPSAVIKAFQNAPSSTYAAEKALMEAKPGKAIREAAKGPLGIVPGVQTIAGGLKGFQEHPVLTALDVLPYVHHFTKGMSIAAPDLELLKGEIYANHPEMSPAELSAAAEAKALHMQNQPHGLNKIIADRFKQAAGKIVEVHPQYKKLLPSEFLTKHLLGGSAIRDAAELGAHENLRFQHALHKLVKDFKQTVDGYGITPQRGIELFKLYETGSPGFRTTLTDPREVGFTNYVEDWNQRFARAGMDRNTFFAWGGDKNVYTTEGNNQLARHVKTYYKLIDRAQSKEARIAAGETLKRGETTPLIDRQRAFRFKQGADMLAARSAPSRFQPLVRELFLKALKTSSGLDEPTFARMVDYLDSGPVGIDLAAEVAQHAGSGHISPAYIKQLAKDAEASWTMLQKAGYDPIFMHHTSEAELGALRHPRIRTASKLIEPSAERARSWMRPAAANAEAQVAMVAHAADYLQRSHEEHLIETFKVAGIVRQGHDVLAELAKERDALKAQGIAVKPIDQMLRDRYKAWEPDKVFPGRRPRFQPTSSTHFISKPVATALERLEVPRWSAFNKVMDPAMGLFRFSVLSLSPAYYGHVAFTSMFMLMAEHGPEAFLQIGDAFKDWKSGNLRPELMKGGVVVPSDITDKTFNYVVGKDLGHVIDREAAQTGMNKLKDALGRPVHGSEAVINFFHDITEQAGYLSGNKSALAELKKMGVSDNIAHVVAEQIGIESGLKLMGRFDRFTPLEKFTVRSVIPFYGWVKFLGAKFMSYPFDHPLRTSFVANFARSELDDWKTGVPERLMNLIYAGQPDSHGRIQAFRVQGLYPMLSVPNMMSIAGLYSHVNPLIKDLLAELGVDPVTANARLYSDQVYDEASTYAGPKRPGIGELIGSFVPQAGALQTALQTSTELRALRKSNPEAFKRRLYLELGIGFDYGRVSLDEEAKKAAARKKKAQAQHKSYIKRGGP